MGHTLNPITLGESKVLSNLTRFIVKSRVERNIMTSDIIRDLVDSFDFGTLEVGFGITTTFYTDYLDVFDLQTKSTLLDTEKGLPKLHQETLTVDTYKMIPILWNEELSRDALTNGALISTFMEYVHNLGMLTKDKYLYDECIKLLKKFYESDTLRETQKIEITRAKASVDANQLELNAIDEFNAKKVAKTIRKTLNSMKAGSKDYNEYDKDGSGAVNSGASKDDYVLYISDTYWTDFIGDTMSSLYHNEDVGEMIKTGKIVLIPENVVKTIESAKPQDFIGILCQRNKFAKVDFYNLEYSFFDGSNLYTHWFLHFAYGMGIFQTKNGVILKYKDA